MTSLRVATSLMMVMMLMTRKTRNEELKPCVTSLKAATSFGVTVWFDVEERWRRSSDAA